MIKELVIPYDADDAEQAIEIFRAWIIDKNLQCSILPNIWEGQPETWGILFADAIQHVSNALSEQTGKSKEEILKIILNGLNCELNDPTEKVEGEYIRN